MTDNSQIDSNERLPESREPQMAAESQPVADSWQQNILSAEHWVRVVFMVLFAFIACAVCYVAAILVIVQFVITLFSGNSNEKLREFGSCLAQYIAQLVNFLTYNREDKPFPFADWPEPKNYENTVDK